MGYVMMTPIWRRSMYQTVVTIMVTEHTKPPGPCSQLICDNGHMTNTTVDCTQDCEYEGSSYSDGSVITSKETYPSPCYQLECKAGTPVQVGQKCKGCMYNGEMVPLGKVVFTDNSYPSSCYRLTCKTTGVTRTTIRCLGCWYNKTAYKPGQYINYYKKGR